MKTNIFKTTLIVMLLTLSSNSCEKDKYEPDCKSGDCVDVNIKGSLRVKPSGEGLGDVPVEVRFVKTGTIFNMEKKVGSGKTNKNGEFDFKVKINSNDGTYLRVVIPEQKNYIYFTNDKSFWVLDNPALRNINFEFYNRASLTINLKRIQTDVFDRFDVRAVFVDGNNQVLVNNYLYRTTNLNANDAIIQIETVADVYTKIEWWKQHDLTLTEDIDSLICKPNVNNEFTINY